MRALVDGANVAAHDELAEPADTPADELGQIGMEERDERSAAASGDAGGAPGRMKRVPDFDEIRLERFEHARQPSQRERQPVIERARHGRTRDRAQAAGHEQIALTGDEQRVAVSRVREQPLVFRVQIATHPAAGRRVEKSGVDDVHRG